MRPPTWPGNGGAGVAGVTGAGPRENVRGIHPLNGPGSAESAPAAMSTSTAARPSQRTDQTAPRVPVPRTASRRPRPIGTTRALVPVGASGRPRPAATSATTGPASESCSPRSCPRRLAPSTRTSFPSGAASTASAFATASARDRASSRARAQSPHSSRWASTSSATGSRSRTARIMSSVRWIIAAHPPRTVSEAPESGARPGPAACRPTRAQCRPSRRSRDS